jgi:hypothetical protein
MPKFGATSVRNFPEPTARQSVLTCFTTDEATKLMVGAYVGVPASMVCVLHHLYITISAPDSLPDKVRQENKTMVSYLTPWVSATLSATL